MESKSTVYFRWAGRHLLIASVLLLFCTKAIAQPALHEPFGAATGTALVGTTGLSWTSIASGSSLTTSTGNLSYIGAPGNGIGNKVSLAAPGQDAYKSFTAISVAAAGTSVYAAAVVNVASSQLLGDYFFALGATTTPSARVYIKKDPVTSDFYFGVARGVGTPVYETTPRTNGVTYFIVLKYTNVAGVTNDIVDLYVNPSPIVTEPTPAVSYSATNGAEATSFSSVQLYQGTPAASPVLDIDAITVGASWATVATAQYDFGDLPVGFEADKDSTMNLPATAYASSTWRIGATFDAELSNNYVANNADNNGTLGDGLNDDAFTVLPIVYRGAAGLSMSVPITGGSGTKYVYGWLDLNGDNQFQVGEAATTTTATVGTSTVTLTWTAAQLGTIPVATTKMYLRLRLSSIPLIDFTTAAAGGANIDERSIGNGATATTNAANASTVPLGEIEDYRLDVQPGTDYGDLPISYEKQFDGTIDRPAVHQQQQGSSLGTLWDGETAPATVAAASDNNDPNGDDANNLSDEDAFVTLPVVYKNGAFTVAVNVTNASGTKYLYGWLDLNGDGKFTAGELSAAGPVSITTVGASIQRLTWPVASVNTITGAKIYMRLRLSGSLLNDYTSAGNGPLVDERSIGNGAVSTTNAANNATMPIGEVEDYQLAVVDGSYDFGDAPLTFDNNSDGVPLAARNIPTDVLKIGGLPDAEASAGSVPFLYSNNGADGDGGDENGISSPLPAINVGAAYSVSVRVTNHIGSTRTLYGWLDLNNDGVFQQSERATTLPTIATGTNNGLVTLTWTAAQMGAVGASKIYMRLRLSSNTNTTNGSTATQVDRLAIGDGNNTLTYGTEVFLGEVEDYQITVNPSYDYGDAPNTYEINADLTPVPARHQTVTSGAAELYLGHAADIATDYDNGPASVGTGFDNNSTNGDGADENGLTATEYGRVLEVGSSYTLNVKVRKGTGVTGTTTLYGWIDFNDNGRFEASEVATATVTGSGDLTLPLVWPIANAASTKTYVRLRLTNTAMTDLTSSTSGPRLDERSIGHGNSAGTYTGTVPTGEVEDYQINTNFVGTPGNMADCPLYGRMQSAFHASIAAGPDGIYKIWGEGVGLGSGYGGDNILTPTAINKALYPAITGTILKATLASNSIGNTSQVIILSTDGLYAAGAEDRIVPTALTSNATCQKILPANGSATTGLPVGVNPADVGYMMATPGALIIRTISGSLYVLGSSSSLYGDRTTATTTADALWHQVSLYTGVPLTNIKHVAISNGNGFAVDAADNFYTWGPSQYLGNGTALNAASTVAPVVPANSNTAAGTFYRARPMAKPAGWVATKMIAMTGSAPGYYALSTDGYLYALGDNSSGQLGIGSTTSSTNWVRVKVNSTTELSDIVSIAANDQDASVFPAAAAITSTGNMYTWGSNDGSMIGQPGTIVSYATVPPDFVTTGRRSNFVEVGGHTTVYVSDGSSKYCYAGHRINGSEGDGTTENQYEYIFNCSSTGDAKVACAQLLDAGDAPGEFESGFGDNRAVHSFYYSRDVYLGTTLPTDEYATLKNVNTNADNEGSNGDGLEEDGVIKGAYNGEGTYSITISAFNNSGLTGTIYGWVDWNNNHIFEPTEIATTTIPASASQQTGITLTWANAGQVQCNTVANIVRSYMRIRLTTEVKADNPITTVDERALSAARDGEVEDYFVDWNTSQYRDFGNIQNTASIFWPAAYATILTSGNRVWLGNNTDNPTAECETNVSDANTHGLTLSAAPLTPAVAGAGTSGDPFKIVPGGSYDLNVTVNGNGPAGTNVYWAAWVDVNGNGRFNDGVDRFVTGVTPQSGPVTAVASISIPGTVPVNTTGKIRVVATGTVTTFTKNDNGDVKLFNGEVEDYYMNVNAPNSIFITGNLWGDANGNGIRDATENNSDGGGGVYVNLVDAANNVVVSVPVNPDGTYSLPAPPNAEGYMLIVTTNPTSVTPEPPTGLFTGESVGAGNIAVQGTELGVIQLTTGITDITQQNFGINAPPTANDVSGSFTNPGGTAAVQVPTLNGADPEQGLLDGAATSLNHVIISTLPASGNLYYNGVLLTAANIATAGNITNYDPALLTFDPPPGGGTYTFTYKEVDAAGKESEAATVTMEFPVLNIGGTAFNDVNGMTDGTVNGLTAVPPGLQAVLIDEVTGLVVAVVPVNPLTGEYLFSNLDGGNYSLMLTTTAATVGALPPAVTLPAGWVSTGEHNGTGPGSDALADGKLLLGTVTETITAANFGIEQPPTAVDNTLASQGNPGGIHTIDITNNFPFTDPSGGTLSAINITSFPSNATSITVGTVTYYADAASIPAVCPTATCASFPATGGVSVPTDATGVPSQPIRIDPVDGNVTPSVSFTVTDDAGKTSSNTATLAIPLAVISVSGTVWDDANGDGATAGEPNVSGNNTPAGGSIPAGTLLYVTLVGPLGMVLQSIPVNADGTYNLENVPANTTGMMIQVSTTQSTVGNAPEAITYPAAWVPTANAVGAGNSAAQTPDAGTSINLNAGSVAISNQSFGIERIPQTDTKTTTISPPAAGSFLALDGIGTNPPVFSGNDGEDMPVSGSLSTKSVAITSLPTNGTLWYNGAVIEFGADGINPPSPANPFNIPIFNPSLLQVEFTGSGYTSLEFGYAYIDAAGVMDQTPAIYNLNWSVPLPVTMEYFTGKLVGCEARLSWRIHSLATVARFEVLRSEDGQAFSVIQKVAADINKTDYTVNVPHSNTAMYQLRVVYTDGLADYSAILMISGGCNAGGVSLLPNPATDMITVIGTDEAAAVTIIDASGKKVVQGTTLVNHKIDVSLLTPGAYHLLVKDNNKVLRTLKFIKL